MIVRTSLGLNWHSLSLHSYDLSLGTSGSWNMISTLAFPPLSTATFGQLIIHRGLLIFLTNPLETSILGYQIQLNQLNKSHVEWKKIEYAENYGKFDILQTATQVFF